MGTGRKFNKKPMTRPIKRGAAKAQKCKAQRARLVKLGVAEEDVAKMDQNTVRAMLQHPTKIVIADSTQPHKPLLSSLPGGQGSRRTVEHNGLSGATGTLPSSFFMSQ